MPASSWAYPRWPIGLLVVLVDAHPSHEWRFGKEVLGRRITLRLQDRDEGAEDDVEQG